MKKILFLFFCLISFHLIQAQEDSSKIKKAEFEKFKEKNPNYAYVYMYVTKGGKEQKFYAYFLSDSIFKVIYENVNEKSFKDTNLNRDELFDYLDASWAFIKKLRDKYDEPNFKIDFVDKNKIITQIGIRYNDLHFNHFLPKTEEQVNKIKDEDARNGQRIINAIAKFFKDKFKQVH